MIKIGDEVFVKGIVEEVYGNSIYVEMPSGITIQCEELDLLQPYHEQPAPVWRDGAVERPAAGATFWYTLKKRLNDPIIGIVIPEGHELIGTSYNDILWLPADEFPMPAMPEPVILACPFCGESCDANALDKYLYEGFVVACSSCWYRADTGETEQEAIAAHNRLARKARA